MTVAVRLTPAEHARWTAAATAGGRGQMGRWVRESITGQLDRRPAPAAISEDQAQQLAALRAELSKIGSNLNQVARALNTANRGGDATPLTDVVAGAIAATKLELARVRDQLAEGGRR